MEVKAMMQKAGNLLQKYRYAGLVIVIGLILMMIPTGKSADKPAQQPLSPTATEESLEDRLSNVLSQIRGAGAVQVLLTKAVGEETVYQTDTNTGGSDSSATSQTDTVTVTDAQRNESGLIRQVNPPLYLGAVIVCQGGNDAAVRLAVVDAVSKVTGLRSDQIAVLTMK